jgi:hypothetical protein
MEENQPFEKTPTKKIKRYLYSHIREIGGPEQRVVKIPKDEKASGEKKGKSARKH